MHSFERENNPYFKRLQEKYEGKAQGQTRHTSVNGEAYEGYLESDPRYFDAEAKKN
jgi:hypothetical protein